MTLHPAMAELVRALPWWQKPVGRLIISQLEGRYPLQEGYNREAAEQIKPALGDVPLIVVGGMRTVSCMEAILEMAWPILLRCPDPLSENHSSSTRSRTESGTAFPVFHATGA